MGILSNLFPRVVNLSAVGSVVILFVLIARIVLCRAPKVFSYALWGIVLVRLLIPVSISSPVSAVPEIQTTSPYEINAVLPEIQFETPADRQENMQNLEHSIQTGEVYAPIQHEVEPAEYLGIIWLIGTMAMTGYSVLSYLKIRKKVQISIPLRDNIYLADDIQSPFVIGLVRPRIYLPCGLSEGEQSYIILHEQHHIHRFDHWIKALAFFALTIHWFNPRCCLSMLRHGTLRQRSCVSRIIHGNMFSGN